MLELPSNLARVYLVSYVSHLRKSLRVLDEEIHTEDMDLQDPLEYLEHFVKIPDQAVKVFTPKFGRRVVGTRKLPRSCHQGINCVQIGTS